jgi:hypothetical protein
MEWKDVIAYIVTPLFTLILILFNLYLNAKLSKFVTESQVQAMLDEECDSALLRMDDKLNNHCPNMTRIEKLESAKEKHTANIEHVNMKLQEITINLKNLCTNNGVKYESGNGN